jgi:serine/threonine protein phosphatase PrpC
VQTGPNLVRGGAPLHAVGLSDTGLRRPRNEDALELLDRWVVLADGLGGHRGGELASRAAVDGAKAALLSGHDAEQAVRWALAAVIDAGRAADIPEARAGLVGSQLHVAHVGDSRAGLLHGGGLTWVTRDHNEAAQLLAQGRISYAESLVHRGQHVVTRSLSGFGPAEPDVAVVSYLPGSRLLLCSDGLNGYVADEVVALVGSGSDLDEAVTGLLGAAYEQGAPDNVTVALAQL